MLYCDYCEIFENILFYRALPGFSANKPATSGETPDLSFSIPRQTKATQRSTMSQMHFNLLAVLPYYKCETDKIDLVTLRNEFFIKSQ